MKPKGLSSTKVIQIYSKLSYSGEYSMWAQANQNASTKDIFRNERNRDPALMLLITLF